MAKPREEAKSGTKRTAFHLQFITTPTSDTPGTTLLLHFDTKTYLFGEFGEGTQRACIERGVGLKKIRGLFLAGKTRWNNGGLIGMILTMADVQKSELDEKGKRPRLNIYAGPMQQHSFACARRFVFRTGMPLSVHEAKAREADIDPQPIHADDNIQVWAIQTQDLSANFTESAIPTPQLSDEQELRRKVVNNMFDSDWKPDQLFQSKLKDVKLPAIVWTRDPEKKSLVTHVVHDLDKASLDPNTDVLVRNPWPASTVPELPPATGLPRNTAMSYVVKSHPQRGNFNLKNAAALGLKPGPKFRKLTNGENVTSDDGKGTIITPEMVMDPTRPGRGFALFDVPSDGYLENLEKKLESAPSGFLDGVEAVIWMTRGRVLRNPLFEKMLEQLAGMKHFISDAHLCNDYIAYDSSALTSSRLSDIAPGLFSIPRFDNSAGYRPIVSNSAAEMRASLENSQAAPATRGLIIHLEPKFTVDELSAPSNLDAKSFSSKPDRRIRKLIPDDASSCTTKSPFISSADLDEPQIITLGTGSAAPSKYRNVSAVLLRMPNGMGNYLFDCGEGTLGSLKRLYDAAQLDDILLNLRAIWISHLHADHHLGTLSVLRAVHTAVQALSDQQVSRPKPPYLISEINMIDYVDEYQAILGLSTESLCTPIPCDPVKGLSYRGKYFHLSQNDPFIKSWRTVKVSHCHGAQAVCVTFKNDFKFSYSGDCRPSKQFCEIGADSDVLVHEATFDDGMDADAMAKKHSTTGEAVGVALGMRAKNLILTHFSQRYQKIPKLSNVKMPERVSDEELLDDLDAEVTNDDIDTNADNHGSDESAQAPDLPAIHSSWVEPEVAHDLGIAVAFDLMHIKVSQIKDMKKLFPAISKMFEVEDWKRAEARREITERGRLLQEENRRQRMEAHENKKMKRQLEKQTKKTAVYQDQKTGNQKRKPKGQGSGDAEHVEAKKEMDVGAQHAGNTAKPSAEAVMVDVPELTKESTHGIQASGMEAPKDDETTRGARSGGDQVVHAQDISLSPIDLTGSVDLKHNPPASSTIEGDAGPGPVKRQKTG